MLTLFGREFRPHPLLPELYLSADGYAIMIEELPRFLTNGKVCLRLGGKHSTSLQRLLLEAWTGPLPQGCSITCTGDPQALPTLDCLTVETEERHRGRPISNASALYRRLEAALIWRLTRDISLASESTGLSIAEVGDAIRSFAPQPHRHLPDARCTAPAPAFDPSQLRPDLDEGADRAGAAERGDPA